MNTRGEEERRRGGEEGRGKEGRWRGREVKRR